MIKNDEPTIAIEEWLSPHGLKMIVDSSPKYRKAFKSYAFGVIKKIASKWVYIAIIGVVVVLVVLYFAGALPTGGR